VVVSMPITTALTVAVLEYTTKYLLVESITMPVRSSTPLADKLESYSMNSALAGVDGGSVVLTAILTVAAVLESLLHNDIETTLNVVDGHIYACVYVVADRAAAPNLPDAIIYFSVVFMLKSN
jgi:hypothetical protein